MFAHAQNVYIQVMYKQSKLLCYFFLLYFVLSSLSSADIPARLFLRPVI